MVASFPDIPLVVIDYIRSVFSTANDKVSRTICTHPSMHEETLDHLLIMELTASPPAFFATEGMGVLIESHWLGGRRMYGRWEIADIALFILLRKGGHLICRKVALLQTKRLYSKEIDAPELDMSDYIIGIGRLADRTDRTIPLSNQRIFSFDDGCVYAAIHAGSEQVAHISQYMFQCDIPVYYGLYNPTSLPFKACYPPSDGLVSFEFNRLGCRIIPANHVHSVLSQLVDGKAPTVSDLTYPSQFDPGDPESRSGWRLEKFIADEVLRCRQGKLFDGTEDPNLIALLYERSAPISAAITITIDIGMSD